MSECQVAISRPSQPTSEFLETLNTKYSQGLGQCAAFMRHTSKFTCTLISLHKPQGQTLRIRSHLQVNQYRHLLKTTSYYQMFNCLCSKYVSQVISYSNFSKAEKHAQVFGDFCFVLFCLPLQDRCYTPSRVHVTGLCGIVLIKQKEKERSSTRQSFIAAI